MLSFSCPSSFFFLFFFVFFVFFSCKLCVVCSEWCLQVRADLRSVCLEALTERTPDGQRAVLLRQEADRLMEKFNKVLTTPLGATADPPVSLLQHHDYSTPSAATAARHLLPLLHCHQGFIL